MSVIRLAINRATIHEATQQILKQAEILFADHPCLADNVRAKHHAYLRGMQQLLIYAEGPGYTDARHTIEQALDELDALSRKTEHDYAQIWQAESNASRPEAA